jgi:transposase
LALTAADRTTLEQWARRRTTAQALALRARIILRAATGQSNTVTAGELRVTKATVGKWRSRFVRDGLQGLLDEPRPGVPRQITDAQVEAVITRTLESTPRDATHGSTRSMAKATDLSQSAISRIWRAFALQPHRVETFKLSKDPLFIDKVRDIVGQPHPPERRWYSASTKEPDSSARSHGADFALAVGCRTPDARLRPPRDDVVVRRARRGDRLGSARDAAIGARSFSISNHDGVPATSTSISSSTTTARTRPRRSGGGWRPIPASMSTSPPRVRRG